MSKYEWRAGMREISGFGGSYEARCRDMLVGGMTWIEDNPNADPQFSGYKNVFGVITEDNEDAKSFCKAIEDAGDNDFSGAMYQSVVSHCLFIKKNGWEEYCKKMSV